MQSVLGICVFILLAWLLSERRVSVEWRLPVIGCALQLVLAYAFLNVSVIAQALLWVNALVSAVEQATLSGTTFLFGYLGGGDAEFLGLDRTQLPYLFAFRVLPQVVVFSALVAILWHWQVLPWIVRGFGVVLRKSLGVSGPVGTAGASSLFLGMVETPMVVRAYLASLTRSEFFALMTFGMSTIAGSVLVLYAGLLREMSPGVVGHILAASVLNMVGAIYIARILVPETEQTIEDAEGEPSVELGLRYQSFMDALTRGTSDGLALAMNVGAMLLVLLSLIALANGLLGLIPVGDAPLTLQQIFGWLFAPLAWLVGIDWHEAVSAGQLLGIKLVLNELVAYLALADQATTFSEESRLILMYSLCGFANFGSLGILLGGLSVLVPERRDEYLYLAPKSVLAGTMVSLLTGAVVASAVHF